MIYTAGNIITRARYVLMEANAKAWTDPELLAWFNDGRSVMYVVRPDLFESEVDFTCAAGHRQTLPDGSKRLFEVDSNVSHKNRRQITLTGDEVLARFRPNWRSGKQSAEIVHYLYDEADGSQFEVYPPALAGTQIRLSYAKPPTVITDLNTTLADEGDIGVAYIDYVLHRAFDKEADTSPMFMERANMHLSRFNGAVGLAAQTKLNLSPNQQREGGVPANVSA